MVIDGKSQAPTQGRLIFFKDAGGYSACIATSGRAYRGVEQRRALILTDNLLVYAFALVSKKKRQVDWLLHSLGALKLSIPAKQTSRNLGKSNGYQHLTNLSQAKGEECFTADWALPGGKLMRVTFIGDSDSTIFAGTGIGYYLRQKVPFLLRRRKEKTTCFVTLYDLSGDGGFITAAEFVPCVAGGKTLTHWKCLGISIKAKSGTFLVGINFKWDGMMEIPAVRGKKVEPILFQKAGTTDE